MMSYYPFILVLFFAEEKGGQNLSEANSAKIKGPNGTVGYKNPTQQAVLTLVIVNSCEHLKVPATKLRMQSILPVLHFSRQQFYPFISPL